MTAIRGSSPPCTSRRPYKEAWSNDRAFALLEHLAGETLDADCVQALRGNHKDVERTQIQIAEIRLR